MQNSVRAITKHVPFRAAATLFNVALSALGRDGKPPNWLISEGVEDYPAMELNVSLPFQRRMFYFPRAYWERLMGLPFGRFMASTLKEGQVFLDIGSNIGFYTLFAAKRVGPTGRVRPFQPHPPTFPWPRGRAKKNRPARGPSGNAPLSHRAGARPLYTVPPT